MRALGRRDALQLVTLTSCEGVIDQRPAVRIRAHALDVHADVAIARDGDEGDLTAMGEVEPQPRA